MRVFSVFFVSCCLFCNAGYAQLDTSQFRSPENFSIAANYYLQQSRNNPSSDYYPYQAACYLSLKGAADSAFVCINRAVDSGAKSEDIITDTDFNRLHSMASWDTLLAKLKVRYLKENLGIALPEQGVELWLLGIEDQRYRTLSKNHKLPGNQPVLMGGGGMHLKSVESVVRQFGWPTIAMVGEKASEAAFLIVQHSNPSDIKRNLPLVVAAAHSGAIKRKWAALMIDRYLLDKDGVQLYGSQFVQYGNRNKVSGLIEWNSYMPGRIAEEENLAERRMSVGLDPIEADAKRFKAGYIPPAQREGYKPVKMKRKYLKMGYLFQ